MKSPVTRSRGIAIATIAAFAVALIPVGAANAAPAAKCDNRNNNTIAKLLECVDADGATEHLEAFQAIADENGGNRAAGPARLRGERRLRRRHPRSRRVERLDRRVRLHVRRAVDTDAADSRERGVRDRAVHRQRSRRRDGGRHASRRAARPRRTPTPVAARRPTSPDSRPAASRSSSAARAPSPTRPSTPRRPAQRGVIIFNQGNDATADRQDLIVGTLGGSERRRHPRGRRELRSRASRSRRPARRPTSSCPRPSSVRRRTSSRSCPARTTSNVVMAGAHLDSVQAGPGINDNGSGSASLLELAQNMSKLKPENTVRLAWWGAEEAGLLGSQAYVDGLSPGREGPHRAVPELRHGRLAELHVHDVRR